MLELVLAVVVVAVAWAFALQPCYVATLWPYLIIAAPHAVMVALYVIRAARAGELADRLRPRSGDLTFGAVAAAMLFGAMMAGRSVLAQRGSVRNGWVVQIYLYLGEPAWVTQRLLTITALVILLALLEEIAWRGYVMSLVEKKVGPRRAWLLTAALQGAAYAATFYQLRDPFAGPNPLIVIAVLGCALVWGFLVARTHRLPIAVMSHALFAWAVLVQFPLLRLG